ncbi:MAG: hypothetical protein KF819_20875 [Labilithrix sp.]|nr:hypothetical protein [Labilithrix sp.]
MSETPPYTPPARRPPPTIWQRTTYRWTAITAVMAALLLLYTQHPYYLGQQFAPWRPLYTAAFVGWLAIGLFYVKATLQKFKGLRYAMRDGGLHLLILAKRSYRDVLSALEWRIVGGLVVATLLLALLRSDSLGVGPLRRLAQLARHEAGGVAQFLLPLSAVILVARGLRPREAWRRIKNPRVRTTVLAIAVKGFFTPLMTGFFSGHANAIADAWMRHKNLPPFKFTVPKGPAWEQAAAWWGYVKQRLPDFVPHASDFSGLLSPSTWTHADMNWGLGLAYDVVFFVDCGWALIGYASESRWLGNKTRSVEPTGFGWVVCLACYPPYNNVLGTYLPLESGVARITNPTTLLYIRLATVLLFTIYSTATVAFGFKFSNLTNRGITSRGPYRFVRHPAYLCKCTAWWLEHIPTITLTKAFFLTLLCGVYALRAWTEERHLSKDPEYLAYKRKVPWILIPGVY